MHNSWAVPYALVAQRTWAAALYQSVATSLDGWPCLIYKEGLSWSLLRALPRIPSTYHLCKSGWRCSPCSEELLPSQCTYTLVSAPPRHVWLQLTSPLGEIPRGPHGGALPAVSLLPDDSSPLIPFCLVWAYVPGCSWLPSLSSSSSRYGNPLALLTSPALAPPWSLISGECGCEEASVSWPEVQCGALASSFLSSAMAPCLHCVACNDMSRRDQIQERDCQHKHVTSTVLVNSSPAEERSISVCLS